MAHRTILPQTAPRGAGKHSILRPNEYITYQKWENNFGQTITYRYKLGKL